MIDQQSPESRPAHTAGHRRSHERFAISFIKNAFRRYGRDEQGVTAIEFAIVGLPFFMLVFGILEFGLAFFVNRIVDNAVLETSRIVRTGQAQGFDKAAFKAAFCNNLPDVFCSPDRIRVQVDKIKSFDKAGPGFDKLPDMLDKDGKPNDDTYPPNIDRTEIVVVRVLYMWPMFTSLFNFGGGDTSGERYLYSTHIFRTEPW